MKFEIEELPDEETVAGKCEEIEGYTSFGLIKVTPSACILPKLFQHHIEEIRNIQCREDDVFLISNPKCGTTWSQEMTWLVGNDLDFEGAKKLLDERFTYIDIVGCIKWMENALDEFHKLPSPRFIKSHLPKVLLPTQIWEKKCKVIFIVRDPRDAAISNFHHYQLFHRYTGSLDEFLDNTLAERVVYSPFWEHAIEFWEMRNEPNVLFITYEEMKQDLTAVIKKTAMFLGKTIRDNDLPKLLHHLSFEQMKNNAAVNFEPLKEELQKRFNLKLNDGAFIRQGKSGGWKENLSPEMVAKFREWTQAKIKGTGLEDLYGT